MTEAIQILHLVGLAMIVAGLVMRIYDRREAGGESGQ